MKKALNVGIVGLGDISGIYLQNIVERYHQLKVVAVCDILYERALAVKEKYGIPAAYQNVEDLVNGFTNPSFPEFMLNKENVREFTNDIIKLFTLKGVASRLRFLNPEVVMQEVDQVIRGYENYYHVQLPNFLRINLFLHTSIMIERVLVKEESGKIDSIDTEGINEESRKFIEVSKDIFKSIMMKYKIEISDAEYLLLYQILQSVIQK